LISLLQTACTIFVQLWVGVLYSYWFIGGFVFNRMWTQILFYVSAHGPEVFLLKLLSIKPLQKNFNMIRVVFFPAFGLSVPCLKNTFSFHIFYFLCILSKVGKF
jgi:hypothetical protein